MSLSINSNIAALNTQGNLHKSQMNLSTSIERLSSGLRINRGADDAAGLTISEKLRGQIKGLNRAVTNAQNGVSLIQTAEGALAEDAAILNRLRELSIQAQEDGLTSNDRLEIQKEVDQLIDDIDRVAKTTEFNKKNILDGSASALVSTDEGSLLALQTGNAGQLSSGDYQIKIGLNQGGLRQAQASNILYDKVNNYKADGNTKLASLTSFYDNDGNSVLQEPKEIVIRGNGNKSSIFISSDMNLNALSIALEESVSRPVSQGGLGISGSTFAFNTQSGQLLFEAGLDGKDGQISFSMGEELQRAFGFQVITESVDAAYKVSATTIGVLNQTTKSASTTSNRASGVLGGLEFEFQLPTPARADGFVRAQDVVQIGTTNVVFTIADTNGNGSTGVNQSFAITVTLTANRSFSMVSVANIVNDRITKSTAPVGRQPGLVASFSGYNLVLTSNSTGTSALVSVNANQAASDILGLRTGNVTGSAGNPALLTSSADLSNGFRVGATNLSLRIADGDRGINPVSTLIFRSNTNISAISLTTQINNVLSNSNLKVRASINGLGNLEFKTTDTGSDAMISLTVQTGAGSDIGFFNGQKSFGSAGNPAIFTGNTTPSASKLGYVFDGAMSFLVSDKNGRSSGTINFYGTGVNNNQNDFALSQSQIVSVLNASALATTDVKYTFDAAGRLDFESRSAGDDTRIVFSTLAAGTNHASVGLNALGINLNQTYGGSGKTNFKVHVSDRSLAFQIGANESQNMRFSIVNTSSRALGLTGLDLTNKRTATDALGAIDRAVNLISSERSKLGSLQNRLNATMNNITTTGTNLQGSESKIRDVDVALETVAFTRAQVMVQSGTSQLAQSRGLTQGTLQILQQ